LKKILRALARSNVHHIISEPLPQKHFSPLDNSTILFVVTLQKFGPFIKFPVFELKMSLIAVERVVSPDDYLS
jgi:hypothetical protein